MRGDNAGRTVPLPNQDQNFAHPDFDRLTLTATGASGVQSAFDL
jgi:hypothetical protein